MNRDLKAVVLLKAMTSLTSGLKVAGPMNRSLSTVSVNIDIKFVIPKVKKVVEYSPKSLVERGSKCDIVTW